MKNKQFSNFDLYSAHANNYCNFSLKKCNFQIIKLLYGHVFYYDYTGSTYGLFEREKWFIEEPSHLFLVVQVRRQAYGCLNFPGFFKCLPPTRSPLLSLWTIMSGIFLPSPLIQFPPLFLECPQILSFSRISLSSHILRTPN